MNSAGEIKTETLPTRERSDARRGQQDRIGILAPGMQADLVLIKGDPSKRRD